MTVFTVDCEGAMLGNARTNDNVIRAQIESPVLLAFVLLPRIISVKKLKTGSILPQQRRIERRYQVEGSLN